MSRRSVVSLGLLLTTGLLFSGCAMQGSQVAAPTLAEYVDYGGAVRALDAAAVEHEYAVMLDEHARAPSSETAIKLALLVSDPRTNVFDTQRALALLEYASPGGPIEGDAESEFAAFLRSMITPLSEASATLADAQTTIAETQTTLAETQTTLAEAQQTLAETQATIADAQTTIADERALRESLQEQLDALKALEERLNASELER